MLYHLTFACVPPCSIPRSSVVGFALLTRLVVVPSRGASKPSSICTYSVAAGPKLPSLVLLVIHVFPSHSHTQRLSHHSLTLAVAQVFAATLRPECKSARSTSRAHTFAYVRPYVLGERNTFAAADGVRERAAVGAVARSGFVV